MQGDVTAWTYRHEQQIRGLGLDVHRVSIHQSNEQGDTALCTVGVKVWRELQAWHKPEQMYSTLDSKSDMAASVVTA